MTKLVKIVDNKYVQIEEYRNPNICFNTNEYNDLEDYCTLRETFDPFEMFYENQKLKKQLEELKFDIVEGKPYIKLDTVITKQQKFINYLEDEINKLKEQIKNYDIWHEVGNDINFLILKKQFYLEILQKYKEIIGDDK